MAKVFSVPFVYSMYGRVDVTAENEAESIEKAKEELDGYNTTDLHVISNYLEDSLEVDEEGLILEVRS